MKLDEPKLMKFHDLAGSSNEVKLDEVDQFG